jgi:uncharacterized protein (DUF885 family)
VLATYLGEHRWDDRLADFTAEGLERRHQELLEALAEFEGMDTDGLSLESQIDHALITHILQALIRKHETVEGHRRNPGTHVEEVLHGVFLLIVKDFAPLPDRLRSALGRVREAPRVLEEAEANLDPEDTPPVWVEVALEQAQGAPTLLTDLLPAVAAQAAPGLREDLAEAGQTAAGAMRAYVDFLETDVLPRAAGEFAGEKALFNERLREEHLVDYRADELLEIGWEQFRQTRGQMEVVAQEIDPEMSVDELLEASKDDHPAAGELLPASEAAMDAARRYVIGKEIVTIPEGEALRLIETPVFLRPIIPYAAYGPPGMLEEKQEGIFLVTPVDPDATEEEQEQRLRSHPRAGLLVTALHEAYPGHHLQLVWSNRQEQLPRRVGILLSTMFNEGWAFYCEELMEELGYVAEPTQRLSRLSDQLWRAARIILDVSLHTKGMSVEEAIDFLVEACRLEPHDARAEVRRYTMTPTQPQCYLMGKLSILELVDEVRRARPEASLREVHDAILGCGPLPPRLMRRQLLGSGERAGGERTTADPRNSRYDLKGCWEAVQVIRRLAPETVDLGWDFWTVDRRLAAEFGADVQWVRWVGGPPAGC